jgi:hypothetical protein
MIKVMPPSLPSMSDASAADDSLLQVHVALQRYADDGGHEIKCTCSSSSSSQPCADPDCQSHARASLSSASSSSADSSLSSTRMAASGASKRAKRKSADDGCVCALTSRLPCGNLNCIVQIPPAISASLESSAPSASSPYANSRVSIQIHAPVSAAADLPVGPAAAPRLNWSSRHGQELSLHDHFLTLFPMFGLPTDQGGLTCGEIGLKIKKRFSLVFSINKQQVESHCVVYRNSLGIK